MMELHVEPQLLDNAALVTNDHCDKLLESAVQPLATCVPICLRMA
ncbi:hypothetical protein ABZS52_23365 [Micromonospora profundi]